MKGLSTLAAALFTTAALAQLDYVNSPGLLGGSTTSGGCMAVCDMDGDGRDDIAILDNSEHVYVKYQQADGSFVTEDYGTIDGSANPAGQWGWAIADIDNNGHKDIVSGGSYDGTHYIRITSPGVYTVEDLDGPNIFTQCMSLGDLDNNGRVDVFACHDDGPPNIWFTNAAGVPQENNAYIDWSVSCTTSPANDMSGNYGSTFTDFDNDGDLDLHISHCRQGVNSSTDCRRWDRLFVNDGTNNYSDEAAAYGLENREQVWTSDFGDYDNDGDLDVVSTTHSNTIMLFQNDGTGHYTDVTAGCGMEVSGFFLQGLFRDFDNDGYLDVITGDSHYYFRGNGDGTFESVSNVFPGPAPMHGFAIGDLNMDGFEDVFANYGGGYINPGTDPDRLWLAVPNGNHWFRVRLIGTVSNRDAVGARVAIHGPFGVKIREVHAGESYGLVNSFSLNFGLGQYCEIDSVVIRWPAGGTQTLTNYSCDQIITVIEGSCVSPVAQINTAGDPVLCTGGGPLTLTAGPGTSYLWSTGSSASSISVGTPGIYSLQVSDGGICPPGQAMVTVLLDPDETPELALSGDPTFCDGSSLTLTSSPADSYLWSNSQTTQAIVVTTAGTYSVTIDGACQDWTSGDVIVTVLPTPAQPTAADVFLPAPGTADLNATGTNVHWYSDAAGATEVGTGSPWTTPFLGATTTFWCADVNQIGGIEYYGAKTDSSSGQFLNNSGVYNIFTAFEDMVIRSVKVYANGAANRTIALIDHTTQAVMAQGTYAVPDGESRVDLNYDVPAGGPYGLRILSGTSQLWRDGDGTTFNWPYALGTLGEITQSSAAPPNDLMRYYYFYDWEVETPLVECRSPLEDVVVDVTTGIGEVSGEGVSAWPNPVDATLTVEADASIIALRLMDVTGRLLDATATDINGTTARVDVSGLASGRYNLQVRTAGRTIILPVMVR